MNVVAGRSMTDRMIGAAKLDIDVYEEVEADTTATSQAAGVVAIVALCSAIGGIGGGAQGVFGGLIAAFVGWLLWAGITYLIGDKLLGGTATWGELLRTLGFAQAPGVLFLLGIVPLLGWLISLVVGLWILVTGVVAIRQALDFGTGRAILTALLGFVPYAILGALLRM
ncbi:MAG: YIP1 family protein [Gemmatimonadetes bacterium]|nr:YIP1 family protein [Gemmatimonadota bacterium]